MKTDLEVRAQAMIDTLSAQRNAAMDGVVQAAAEIALRGAKIKALEDQIAASAEANKTTEAV